MANPKLSDFLSAIAEKKGIDKENPNLKALLSEEAFQSEVTPDLFEGYSNGLLTLESAKNNNDLHKFYKGKVLGSFDNMLKNQLKEIGLSEEKLNEFESIQDSYERVKKVGELVKGHLAGSSTGNDTETVKRLKTEYAEVQNKLSSLSSTFQAKESQWESERSNIEVNFNVEAELRSVPFADAFANGDGLTLLKTKINDAPYVFKKDASGQIGVFQKQNPELEAFDEANRKLTLKNVVDKLAQPYVRKTPAQPAKPQSPSAPSATTDSPYIFGKHKQTKSA